MDVYQLGVFTATGAGTGVNLGANQQRNGAARPCKTLHAAGLTSSGAGAATILIEGSNDGLTWVATAIATINLTLGTTAVADGAAITANWPYLRARCTALSGTGASVSVSAAD